MSEITKLNPKPLTTPTPKPSVFVYRVLGLSNIGEVQYFWGHWRRTEIYQEGSDV